MTNRLAEKRVLKMDAAGHRAAKLETETGKVTRVPCSLSPKRGDWITAYREDDGKLALYNEDF